MKNFLKCFLGYFLGVNFMASLLVVVALILNLPIALAIVCGCAFVLAFYLVRRNHISPMLAETNVTILMLIAVAFTILMCLSGGGINSRYVTGLFWGCVPFYPLVLLSLYGDFSLVYAALFAMLLTASLVSILFQKPPVKKKLLAATLAVVLITGGISAAAYMNRPELRYGGHGFKYMNGYSSTDFTGYHVYSDDSRLVSLDHEAALRIEGAKYMPVMDGAEACYPLYAAVAKAIYVDIDQIEREAMQDEMYQVRNGRIVSFTNSVRGLVRVEYGEADLFFGAKPSRQELDMMKAEKIPMTITPIGKEGFVFFVEDDNPVDNLTSQQIRDIYSGKITNWSEVGGKNQKIVAFQRPRGSGSQSMMEYFMGDTPLMEPKSYEMVSSMDGVIKRVAEYNNEAGAFGYSFRYFLEELNQEKDVKMISIDGVAPTRENISNGSYPLITDLCLITRDDNTNPYVKQIIDFMLSEDGQYLVEQTGYGRMN